MILSNVNIGTGPSAGDGDPLRSAFSTINNNFQTITNNVNALTNSVTTVAGRTGNVILTINDIVGLNTTYTSQANTTAANTAMRGYVDSKIAANIALLVNAAPSTLDTIRELADAIGDDPNFAVNVALSVSSANTKMRSYVDGQILAANAGVTSANLGMKGYVDSQIGGTYSNINVQSYLTTNSYTTQAYVNLANTSLKSYTDGQVTAANSAVTTANIGVIGYIDQANTIQSAQVNAANLAIIAANLGMKGYVDSVATLSIYGNSNVASYLPTYSGNLTANYADFNFLSVSDGPTGIDALHVGIPGISPFGNCIASFHSNVNAPSYINVHNKSTEDKNLAGFVATAYSSTNLERYNVTLQVASEGFNIPIFPSIKPFDSVVESIGGNLHITAHDIDFTPNKDIIFSTGFEPIYEKVRISNSSVLVSTNMIPSANVTYSLGNITHQWRDLFVSSTTIYLGGVPLSVSGSNLLVNGNAVGSYGNAQVDSYLPSYTGSIGAGNVTVSNTGAYKLGSGSAKVSSSDNTNVELTPDTAANALAGVKIGGSGFILGPNGARNLTLNYNSVSGALGLQGNVTIGTQGSGNLWVMGNVIARDITGGNILTNGSIRFADTTTQTTAWTGTVSGGSVTGNVAEATLAYAVNISPVLLNQEYPMAILPSTTGAYGIKSSDGTLGFTFNPARNRMIVGNIQLGADGNIRFADGTTQTTAANYGNIQVAQYLPSYSGTLSAGFITVPGTTGKIGFDSSNFAQQTTSNATQVTSNTTCGNIQLMTINLGVNSVHTVAFACNQLTTNDVLLVKHIGGGITSVYVDAYVASNGLAVIWMRNISGADTGNFTPMLKYFVIQAPN